MDENKNIGEQYRNLLDAMLDTGLGIRAGQTMFKILVTRV